MPLALSALAAILVLPMVFGMRSRVAFRLEVSVGADSVAFGVAGTVLHLRGAFFVDQSLHNLVY